jgi:vesicle transport through interaction with t-SNAREs protein 1
LLSGPGYPSDDPYTDDPSSYSSRARLLQGTETLQDGSRRLDNAHRIALETEDVGADILRNLRGQREQIEHTRDTVSAAITDRIQLMVSSHRRILPSIGRLGH